MTKTSLIQNSEQRPLMVSVIISIDFPDYVSFTAHFIDIFITPATVRHCEGALATAAIC